MERAPRKLSQGAAALVVAALVLAATATAGAMHTGVQSDPHGGATISDRFKIKTRGPSKVFTTHVLLGPGAYTAWHKHPGPHIVNVKHSTLRIFAADCATFVDYGPGTGFVVDDPEFVHAAKNLSSRVDLELVVTDIREDGQSPTIALNPQPSHQCLVPTP